MQSKLQESCGKEAFNSTGGGGCWSGKINNTRVFEGDGREDGGIGGEGRAFLVEGST